MSNTRVWSKGCRCLCSQITTVFPALVEAEGRARLRSAGRIAAVAGVLLVSALAGTVAAQSIGVNFVDNGNGGVQNGSADSLGPAESAGAPGFAQINWNNLGRWGATVAVNDSTGAASGATVTWDSNNTWNSGATTSTPDGKLMHGYIDATGQINDNSTPYQFWSNVNKPEAYVKGLSAWLAAAGGISYTVVVYSDGDATEGRRSEYWLQGIDSTNTADPPTVLGADLTSQIFLMDSANFSGSYAQVPLSANSVAGAVAGNFMIFSGLTADSFVLRTEEQSFRAQINGFQIVAVKNIPATVTITGTQSAAEPATAGTFTVTRTGGSTGDPLNVYYTVTGTATAGVDYQTLAGVVTIPADQAQATITVTPIDDGLVEPAETVIVSLLDNPAYTVGTPGSDQVNLTSDDVTWTITAQATDAAAAEVVGNAGTFTLTRTGGTNTLFPLTVNYTVSGTATNGTDYTYLPGTAVIPAGQVSVDVVVTPVEDGTTEGPETAILTIADNAPQYVGGAPNSDTVTIADNGSWSHWTQSLTLVFAGYSGSEILTDFPVLVVLTPDRVGNYAGFAPNGADIRFKAGDVNLPYEIEKWNPAGTSYVWVRVPQIASATDSITLVWNNPTALDGQGPNVLWSENYLGVWHLNAPNANGRYPNSTLQGSDGTNFGATPVDGWIGGALSFDATQSNYVDTGNTVDIANWTVATWVRSPEAPNGGTATGPVHREQNYQINWSHGDPNFRAAAAVRATTGDWQPATTGPLQADTWYYLVGTYDGLSLKAYRNGVLVTENTIPHDAPMAETNSLKFARHAAAAQFFTGIVDEVQVLTVAQSPSWIANQYASTADNLIAYGGAIAQVQIIASKPNAAEPSTNGEFLITRSGGTPTLPLTVYYQVSGTATPGKDYTALPSTVTLAAGQMQAAIPVNVIQDWVPLEGTETVSLTLQDRANYNISGAPAATVSISDIDLITDWQNKQRIAFGGYQGTTALLNFPVVITLTPDRAGGYAGFGPNGSDIRFTDATGTTILSYEIERWDANGTSLIWVNVPRIQTPQDAIWMYWNNPGAQDAQDPAGVWAADYLAVYHFADPAAVGDSTGTYPGADHNTTSVAGAVGLGRGFDGSDAYVDCGVPFLSGLPRFTISGWFNIAALTGSRIALFGQNDAIEFGLDPVENLSVWVNGPGVFASVAHGAAAGEWHHVAVTGDGTNVILFVDGALALTTVAGSTNYGASGDTVKIGAAVWDTLATNGNWFDGLMDEVRFAGAARSADWMAAEYASMTGTLIRCGTPFADIDGDGIVDQNDFGVLQRCFTGTAQPLTGPLCACLDINNDHLITAEDVAAFNKCWSGPGVPANPDCLNTP